MLGCVFIPALCDPLAITPHLQQGQGFFALSPSASLGTNGFFDLSQDLPENQDFSLGLCCVTLTLDPLRNTKRTKMAQRWDGRPRDLFCIKRLRPSCCQPDAGWVALKSSSLNPHAWGAGRSISRSASLGRRCERRGWGCTWHH